ncbi:hypothetical protein C5F61_18755 [Photobacterium damselae subsp. damselae]|uniref:hypothetical protein n=1 Tax=Photobacterium damselae TaxID=38293 RepID=UPI000D061E1D|nr:hypothetical protein [Photobacterium damselae]PSB75938.1 hypothetical protein C5F61_18755 [Photobacterium damselae subsp. damselae]
MNELRSKIFKSIEHLDCIKYSSKTDIDQSKLFEAYPEVQKALDYYCPTSSFSDLIIKQLAMVASHQCVELNGKFYPYILSVLLERMRLVEINKPKYKPFKGKDSPLKGYGLYHVHHSLNFETLFNFKRYFEHEFPDDSLIYEAINVLKKEYPERTEHWAIFVKSQLIKSVEWGAKNKTGEWLIYQVLGDQVHFVAFALHETTDQHLFEQLEPYLQICT